MFKYGDKPMNVCQTPLFWDIPFIHLNPFLHGQVWLFVTIFFYITKFFQDEQEVCFCSVLCSSSFTEIKLSDLGADLLHFPTGQ